VHARGVAADEQLAADLPVTQACGDQAEDVEFPGGESGAVTGVRRRVCGGIFGCDTEAGPAGRLLSVLGQWPCA
jgi:hypothetical protein